MHLSIPLSIRTALLAAGLSCIALYAPTTLAASQYQQDVAHCHNTPGIDVNACLKEAGAAQAAARRNQLVTPPADVEARNQKQRCEKLPIGQREECLQLMENSNTQVQGSIQSGGVLRETTITLPANGS